MSRPGNDLDNAVAASSFDTLKTEWIYPPHYKTRREARLAISEHIAGFCNTERRDSPLDYRSPEQCERTQSAAQSRVYFIGETSVSCSAWLGGRFNKAIHPARDQRGLAPGLERIARRQSTLVPQGAP